MTWHMLYLFIHFVGLAVAVGAVIVVDSLFFQSRKNQDLGPAAVRVAPQLSRLIWAGLALLIVSGFLLYLEHPDRYLHSPRFQMKMALVVIAAINGIYLNRRLLTKLPQLFDRSQPLPPGALVSGVVSVVSWVGAILMATFGRADVSLPWLIGGYLAIVAVGIGIGKMVDRPRSRAPINELSPQNKTP